MTRPSGICSPDRNPAAFRESETGSCPVPPCPPPPGRRRPWPGRGRGARGDGQRAQPRGLRARVAGSRDGGGPGDCARSLTHRSQPRAPRTATAATAAAAATPRPRLRPCWAAGRPGRCAPPPRSPAPEVPPRSGSSRPRAPVAATRATGEMALPGRGPRDSGSLRACAAPAAPALAGASSWDGASDPRGPPGRAGKLRHAEGGSGFRKPAAGDGAETDPEFCSPGRPPAGLASPPSGPRFPPLKKWV